MDAGRSGCAATRCATTRRSSIEFFPVRPRPSAGWKARARDDAGDVKVITNFTSRFTHGAASRDSVNYSDGSVASAMRLASSGRFERLEIFGVTSVCVRVWLKPYSRVSRPSNLSLERREYELFKYIVE